MGDGTITEGQILTGVMFNEPMRVVITRVRGAGAVIAGLAGQNSRQFREATLTAGDIASLNTIDPNASYEGDGDLLRLALDVHSLGIAHEFDPYFGLSISRVDPLPRELGAVYEHFRKLPSVIEDETPSNARLPPWRPSGIRLRQPSTGDSPPPMPGISFAVPILRFHTDAVLN